MANEMSQFKIEDAEGNITTYEIVDAQARADIQSLELNGGGGSGVAGENGATFTPSVDANGNLSWTNDKGLANPTTVNIMGPTGATGATGSRGTGIYVVTTAPSGYTTAVGGFTPKYRIALSTVKSQSGATEILVGDNIRYSYYLYPVGYTDGTYAYASTRTSIRGTAGTAGIGIKSIVQTTTSTADDGNNVITVTLTDDTTSTFTVQNGSKGSDGAGMSTYDIPDYWEPAIETAITKIKANQDEAGKDGFSYVVLTDMHYPSNLGKNSPAIARRIMDACGIKYALILGDTRTRGLLTTKEAAQTEWNDIDEMLEPLRGRLLMTQGNHDAGYGKGDYDGDGDSDNYAYEFTPAEMFERVYRKAGESGEAVYDASGTAFYVDDVSRKVRFILLNTHLNFDGNGGYSSYETVDGMAKYPAMWIFRYTQSQFDFLANVALATVPNDGWRVVVGSHVPINQSGEMPDYQLMVGLLNAYKNKTTYTGEFAGTAAGGSVSEPNFTNLCNTADPNFLDNQYMYNDNMVITNPENGRFISNYIPAVCPSKVADIVRVKGIDRATNICIYSFDSSFNKLTFTVSSAYSGKDFVFDDEGILTYKAGYVDDYISSSICNKVAYVRISGQKLTTAEDIVITVNEEITYTETESARGYDSASVSCDFRDSCGELVCYNAGHIHRDSVMTQCHPTGNPIGFPIVTTRCDAKEENDSTLKSERIAGTATEQSFDVFTVNSKTGTINAVKVGAGSDRTISYGSGEAKSFSVSSELFGCVLGGSPETVARGEAYNVTVSPNEGGTLLFVNVEMGGIDVTHGTYSNGSIQIPAVSGNIRVKAVAIGSSSFC